MKTARLYFTVFIVILFAQPSQAQVRSEFFQSGVFLKNTTRAQKNGMTKEVDLIGNRRGITFALLELLPSMKLVMAPSEILSIKNSLKKPYPASFIQ